MIGGVVAYWRAALRLRALAAGAVPRPDDALCAYRLRARDRAALRGRVATVDDAPEALARRDVRVLLGTPARALVLLDAVERAAGRAIRDVWPAWRGFVHAGADFAPFEPAYRHRFGRGIVFVEAYAAPDGGILALQDRPRDPSLAVVSPLGLDTVEVGCSSVLPATGDNVRVVSVRPARIVIERRAGLNAFGERVAVAELESAVAASAAAHGCTVRDFAIRPEIPGPHESRGRHLWLVEFAGRPPDLVAFAAALDAALAHGNPRYAAARRDLRPPHLRLVPPGSLAPGPRILAPA